MFRKEIDKSWLMRKGMGEGNKLGWCLVEADTIKSLKWRLDYVEEDQNGKNESSGVAMVLRPASCSLHISFCIHVWVLDFISREARQIVGQYLQSFT